MKKNVFATALFIFLAFLAVTFSACKNSSETPVIIISEHPAELTNVIYGNINGTLNVTASVMHGGTLQYQWFSNTSGSNTHGTPISGATSASFAIPADLEPGKHYFFVLLRADGAASERSNVATVSVIDKVVEITVSPPAAVVHRGGFQVFNAAITPVQPVIWEVTGGGAGTSINNGFLSVAANETAESLIVRASSASDPTVSATAVVTIPAAVTSITVTPAAVSLERGETQHFDAAVTGIGSFNPAFSWIVSGNSSSGTNITQSGLLTIASDETNPNLTVRAISTFNPSISGTAFVYIYIDDPVQRVAFAGNTATVNLRGLVNNDIYLVRVNTSTSEVTAANTGRVLNVPGILSQMPVPNFKNNDTETERFIPGRPDVREFNANPPPLLYPYIEFAEDRRVFFIPPVLGETRNFWLDNGPDGSLWQQNQATLLAIGDHGNIWVVGNSITTAQAQTLAARFDIIYPVATNLLGYEYGKRPGQTPNGRDGDPRIQILVYEMHPGLGGYFWSKDWRPDGTWGTGPNSTRSNEAEIFYINSLMVSTNMNLAASILAHELSHMIHWNEKQVRRGSSGNPASSPIWYNEMTAMMLQDILDGKITSPSNPFISVNMWMPTFLAQYHLEGVTEWRQVNASYATKQFFGSYLLRNFGGAEFLRRMAGSGRVGTDSVTWALNQLYPGMSFREALLRYGEALIFSGNQMPPDVLSFDRTDTRVVNGITYTAPRFNIRSGTGPAIFALNEAINMRPSSIVLHSDNTWRGVSGDMSITLERPAGEIEMIIMIR